MEKETTKKIEINQKSRMNVFKFLIVLIIVLVVIVVFVKIFAGKGKTNNENSDYTSTNNGVEQNKSTELLKDKEFEGLKFKEIALTKSGDITSLTAKVVNNTGNDYTGKDVSVKFLNQDGTEYSTLTVYVSDIKNGEEGSINAQTTADVVNAYNFVIEKMPTE